MRLARRCDLNAAEVSIGHAEDISYLLVKRYDRVVSPGDITRLHQEDLCQALGLPPYLKYEWNMRLQKHGATASDLFRAVSQGAMMAPNRIRLLDAFIYNILVCNVDSHAKNYALLFLNGIPQLAPIYDVMCARIYDGITENLPQKIAEKQRGDHIYGRHWTRFAGALGLGPAATRRRVRQLAERILVKSAPLAQETRDETPNAKILDKISARIEARCHRVLTNLDDTGISAKIAEAEVPFL